MDVEKIESLSFEDSYALLEQVIHKLESGNLSLEESVALYEQGIKLAAHCERKLDDAQLRVTQLLSTVSDEDDENAESEA